MKRKLIALALTAAMFTGMSSMAVAAESTAEALETDFPTKQINLIIQAAAGGESDSTGRLIDQIMEQKLGVPVVAQNKPGASGAVAFQYVREQPADGYTIGICPAEIAMVDQLGFTDVGPNDMDFIGGACVTPSSVIVRADAPYDTLPEFVEYCKEHPGEVKNATSGAGSTLHVGSELFAQATGIEFNYIPFDGSGPAVTAVMGNHADVAIIGVLSGKAGVDSGDLKILGILGEERSFLYPEIQTAKEQGIDVEYYTWVGMYGPKGMDPAVLAKLEAAMKAGVEADPYQDFAKERGLNIEYRNAADFTDFVMEQYEMYKELIPTMDLK